MEVEFNPYSKKTPINIVIKLLNSVEIPVFFVFFLICSFTFFFYIKEDIVNESVDKDLMNTEKY